METQQFDFGMIGLGTMGRNLVYNICEHGYTVAGFDKDFSKLKALEDEKGKHETFSANTLNDFLKVLKQPRVIILLVPAGPIVDSVIDDLKPFISENDLIMDCGNSHFTDTDRRIERLSKDNIHFMGVGISGGESGARFGPSIMPGGNKKVFDRVAEMLSAVSAKVNNEPCVAYMGKGSAGHYVKMVHNGIEYALMQSIAESYQLLKIAAGLDNDELHDLYDNWNQGVLQSYLVEITAAIFSKKDELSPGYLIDGILDSAHQKGTGMWMSQNALDLHVPVPAIDAAVSARDLSAYKDERVAAAKRLPGLETVLINDKVAFVKMIEQALYFSMITTFAQGLSLLHKASETYHYDLNPAQVVKIWRGGCIIRAAVLERISSVFEQSPTLPNLLVGKEMAGILMSSQQGIRQTLKIAIEKGIPVPCLMASLAYYEGYRTSRLPSNLLQAQRDLFGAHTYQRLDQDGDFHTQWIQ